MTVLLEIFAKNTFPLRAAPTDLSVRQMATSVRVLSAILTSKKELLCWGGGIHNLLYITGACVRACVLVLEFEYECECQNRPYSVFFYFRCLLTRPSAVVYVRSDALLVYVVFTVLSPSFAGKNTYFLIYLCLFLDL